MKFEKHLKNTGLYGIIFTASNGDKYLRTGRNGNVLARVPAGFAPVGQPTTQNLEGWINDLLIENVGDLPEAGLFAARLEKDGRAKDIKRVFRDERCADEFGDRECTIDNTAFGLIERGDDVRIFDPAIDLNVDEDDLEPIDEEPPKPEECETLSPALVILDRDETVVGIILDCGCEE
jgi:hypothetical protein